MDEQNLQNAVEETVIADAAVETVAEETAVEQIQNNYQDYTAEFQTQPVAPAPDKENNTLAIVSLVLGIIALVTSCCGSGFMFGVGGIICAIFANKQKKTGMAKGGLITSIIGIVISIIATVIITIVYIAAYSYSYY